MDTLNIVNSLISYSDPAVTNSPAQRAFDFTRQLSQLQVSNPASGKRILAPGEAATLFDGIIPTSLGGGSSISVQLVTGSPSVYRMSVAGPASFRTARAVTAIAGCIVSVNNNSVVTFAFAGASLTGVIVGDVLRVSGSSLNDAGPFAFNPLNAGLWKIIAISGTQVSCVRFPGDTFAAANETVTTATADVQFYSAAGVQVGSKFRITGTLSPASQRTYEVAGITPNTVDFVSADPLPNESGVSYVASSIIFYSNSKRLLYLEADQDASVRLNGDAGDNVLVNPVLVGDARAPGFMSKWGDTYSAVVVNKSLNSLNLQWFSVE